MLKRRERPSPSMVAPPKLDRIVMSVSFEHASGVPPSAKRAPGGRWMDMGTRVADAASMRARNSSTDIAATSPGILGGNGGKGGGRLGGNDGGSAGGEGGKGGSGGDKGGRPAQHSSQPGLFRLESEYHVIVPSVGTTPSGASLPQKRFPLMRR
eukprot:scaffold281636_cov35-Tisochrysis_lutea.AAC.6